MGTIDLYSDWLFGLIDFCVKTFTIITRGVYFDYY